MSAEVVRRDELTPHMVEWGKRDHKVIVSEEKYATITRCTLGNKYEYYIRYFECEKPVGGQKTLSVKKVISLVKNI